MEVYESNKQRMEDYRELFGIYKKVSKYEL